MILGSGLIQSIVKWLQRDHFTTTLPAGSVNGTGSEPGPGLRTVADVGSNISTAGGELVIAGGTSTWGETSLELTAQDRASGRVMRFILTPSDTETVFAVGGYNSTSGNIHGAIFNGSGQIVAVTDATPAASAASTNVIGRYGIGDIEFLVVERAAGVWLFARGNRWLTPTMIYSGLIGTESALMAYLSSYDAALTSRKWAVSEDVYVPVPLASDSFDRAAIGSTDGAGHPEANGGGSLTWTERIGTWGISSNKARALTVVGNQAIATVDTTAHDVILEGNLESNSAFVGLVFWYVDTNNYCYAVVGPAYPAMRIYNVVGGTASFVATTAITYLAGARLHVRAWGNEVTAVYNGASITGTISESVFDSSTKHGIFAQAAGSVVNVDNFVVWSTDNHAALLKYSAFSPPTSQVEVYREDADNFLISVSIDGEPDELIKARWRLSVVETAWFLNGLAIVDWHGDQSTITFMDNASAYEYAFSLGATGDIQGEFELVGGLHGNINQTSASIELDSADVSGLPVGHYAYGTQLVVTQTIDAIYPKDGVTVAGETTLTHTIDATRVRVAVTHDFNSADDWEIYTHYTMMLPVLETAADTGQVEGFSAAALDADDNSWTQTGTEATWIEMSDMGHDYVVRAEWPDGGPNTEADWSNSGTMKIGIQDRSDGINKGYGINVSTTFANRIAVAGTSISSRTDYTVAKQ